MLPEMGNPLQMCLLVAAANIEDIAAVNYFGSRNLLVNKAQAIWKLKEAKIWE